MTSYRDPPRLRDLGADLPRGLEAALSSDLSEFPQASELSDLTNRLGPLLGTATVAAAAAIPASLMAPKAPLSLVGTLKLIALKWGHTVILPMAIGAASGAVAWEARDYVVAKESAPPAVIHKAPPPVSAAASRGKSARRESPSAAEDEVPADPAAANIEPAAPQARAPSTAGASRATAPAAPPVLEPAPLLGPAENVTEIELIDRAQRALAEQPAVARQWIEEHARRFPEGTFAQEREAIAIEALVGEGRVVEANARAAQFRSKFPESAYLRRVDAVLRSSKNRPPN